MKKYFLLLGVMLMIPACANAELSVKETMSPEFLHNQGYSDDVSRIIQIKTKDPMTPISAESKTVWWKKWGMGVLKTIDPALDTGTEFPSHNTNFNGSNIDDL